MEESSALVPQFLSKVESGDLASLSKEEIRGVLAELESKMMVAEESRHIDCPLKHHFSKDVYARELFIPKGTLAIGKIHKHQNLNIMSKGELSILSVDGCFRVKAPYTIVSDPGVKRLVYAHEDTVWTTIHGTSETDLEKIEETFIAKTYADVIPIEHNEARKLEG